MFEKILKEKSKKNRGIFQGLYALLLAFLVTGCSTAFNSGLDNNEISDEEQRSIMQSNNLLSTDEIEIHYIYTAEDLKAINGGVEGYEEWSLDDTYILMNSIDLSGYSSWEPIGSAQYSAAFTGVFDGNGFTITGLTIDSPDNDFTGFFGNAENCIIKNLKIKDCSIIGKDCTGGIVGQSTNVTIENCSVSGVIKGNFLLGGIIGVAFADAIIDNCFSSVTIIGLQPQYCQIGGLVGGAIGNSGMKNCRISNSYAKGLSVGESIMGGILGCSYGHPVTLTNCYAVSTITPIPTNTEPTIVVGGLIGENVSYTELLGENIPVVTSCYYDIQATPATESVNNFGTKVTSEQMKQQGTFSGWDFVSIWQIDSERNGGYPFLRLNLPF